MRRLRIICVVIVSLSFILIQAIFNSVQACDKLEQTALGIFEQCRWFRYDKRTNTVRFCMRIERLLTGDDPIFVVPFLKSGNIVNVVKMLDRQPVSIQVGECKTLCWEFSKPDDLDLMNFYEYTDFENEDEFIQDYIWRIDKIAGFPVGSASVATNSEPIVWPLFNEGTKKMSAPIQVVTTVDMSKTLPGWQVIDIHPEPGVPFTLHPGEAPLGTITIQKPDNPSEGISVIRPQLINTATGQIAQEVNLRFEVDKTPPKVIEAGAQREGDQLLFRVVAADTDSGLADAVQVHISVNGGPMESFFLDSFALPKGPGPFIFDSPCVAFGVPTTFSTRLGPFKPTDLIQYFFTIPDEAGNITETPAATIHLSARDSTTP